MTEIVATSEGTSSELAGSKLSRFMHRRVIHPIARPEAATLAEVGREVARARAKFPSNEHLLAALVEEVGELAQALLQGQPAPEVVAEAIQVAAVAVRIVEEGDADFGAWCTACYQARSVFEMGRRDGDEWWCHDCLGEAD